MSGRLWDKGGSIRSDVHALTVGDDPAIDAEIAWADAVGSAAHLRMLSSVGLFPGERVSELLAVLKEVYLESRAGQFSVPYELEDMHTAIEARLVERCGDAGKRIHAARSRNDQVQLALRIFTRESLLDGLSATAEICSMFLDRAEREGHIPMPGYTHFQQAMPSSVKMWLHSYAEWGVELLRLGQMLWQLLNYSPLGAAAGFGVPLPINRAQVAELLAFSGVQRNPIDVNNSRGRHEQRVLRWMGEWGALFEKFACDLILFTTSEFGFMSLPDDMTTGSSIMPQKRNPDLVELMRGITGRMRGALSELDWVLAKLPSSYHRDFQYSKAPVLRAVNDFSSACGMCRAALGGLKIDKQKLADAMQPELYATYHAYRLVQQGEPFRDAYRKTADELKRGTLNLSNLAQDFEPIARGIDSAAAAARTELKVISESLDITRATLQRVYDTVFTLAK